MVPTELLPPEFAHVRFPIGRYREYQQLVSAGQIKPVGSIQRVNGTVYTTIRKTAEPLHRAPVRPWVRPAVKIGSVTLAVFMFVWGVTELVGYLVRELTDAVTQAAPVLGALVALSLVLFGLAGALRRRTFSGTFSGTIR